MKTWPAKIKHAIVEIRDFLDEKAVGSANHGALSPFYRFALFWLGWRRVSTEPLPDPRRRAGLHHAARAIPMLAVALSVSSAILKKDGEERINHYLDKVIASFAPPSASEATNHRPPTARLTPRPTP